MLGYSVQPQKLEQSHPEGGQHRGCELAHLSLGEPLDDVVERCSPLDGPVGDLHGQCPVASGQRYAAGLRRERPVGIRAALENPTYHLERTGSSGAHARCGYGHLRSPRR